MQHLKFVAYILCIKMDKQSRCVQLKWYLYFLCLKHSLLEGSDLQHIDPPQFFYIRELLSIYTYQSDMLSISLQLFLGTSALRHLCLSVSSAVVCGNWSLHVGAWSPLDYLKTRSLSCILLRDTAYKLAGKSCHRSAIFTSLCKSLGEDQNSHMLLSQHLADCLNSLCTTRVAHEAPNLFLLLYWNSRESNKWLIFYYNSVCVII